MINIHKIAIFLVFALLFIILRDEMISIVENAVNSSNFVVSRSYYVLLALVTLGYFMFHNRVKFKGDFLPSLLLLLMSVYIISLIHSIYISFSSISNYITIALPLLFLIFIINVSIYIRNEIFFDIIFIIVFVSLSFYYFKTYDIRSQVIGALTSSSGYAVLYFLPFMLCVRNKFVKYAAILITIVVVLLTYKRGGIIALGFALSVYWLVTNYVVGSNIKKKIWMILSLIVSLFVFYQIFINIEADASILNRFQSISEDEGSGRLDVFSYTWDMIQNSDLLGILFGHGWDSVLRDSSLELSAHNDWLEIIYDFGLIVTCIYIYTIYKLLRYAKRLIKSHSYYAAPFAASLTIYFINTTVSHIFIYSNYLTIFVAFWGYVLSRTGRINLKIY